MDTIVLWIGGSLLAVLAILIVQTMYAGRRRSIIPTPPSSQECKKADQARVCL